MIINYNVTRTNVLKTFVNLKGDSPMKEAYILEINKHLNQCNDIPLLDLILKLLQKSS